MNLYLLQIVWKNFKNDEWDKFHGLVIAAESPKEARKIANYFVGNSGETQFDLETGEEYYKMVEHPKSNEIWLKPKYTKLKMIGTATKGIKKGVVFEKWING